MFQSEIPLYANLFIDVYDPITQEIIDKREVHNLVVTAGRNLLRDALYSSTTSTVITHFGVGTSTVAAAASDTDLTASQGRFSVTSKTQDSAKLTVTFFLNTTSTVNGSTLAEAGLFTGSSTTNTMYARATYIPITKSSAIEITYSWELTWGV